MDELIGLEDRPADLRAALLDPAGRAAVVRAAVVRGALADAAVAEAGRMLDDSVEARSAALVVARALVGRRLVPALLARLADPGWAGVEDPARPGASLAQGALRFAVEAVGPRRADVRAALERAVDVPGLRVIAWRALADDAPTVVLPSLGALLAEAPGLAEEVATRFALVHGALCPAACRAVAGLPAPTRRAFGAALEKHLRRVSAIRRWAECRRILFGP